MRNRDNDVTIKPGGLTGTNLENQMSISLNSNEEISFVVTPDSNAMNISDNYFGAKRKQFTKKGVVPNTKLIFEENKEDMMHSPVIGARTKELCLNQFNRSQQNPAIYEASKSLAQLKFTSDRETHVVKSNRQLFMSNQDQ